MIFNVQSFFIGMLLALAPTLESGAISNQAFRFQKPFLFVKSERAFAEAHANEVLSQGSDLVTSPFRNERTSALVEEFVFKKVLSQLKFKYKNLAGVITHSLIHEANVNQLDPIFLLAIVRHESRLNPEARGRHGEIGLMQLRPETARWISSKNGLPWKGESSLSDPQTNIKLGALYFKYLRHRYQGNSQYYLTAYNMGPVNLNRVLRQKLNPEIYADAVIKIYRTSHMKLNQPSTRINIAMVQ